MPHSVRHVDDTDAVAHRHDHIGAAQDVVGDRSGELLARVEAEFRDRGAHLRVDLGAGRSAGGMDRYPSVRQLRGDGGRDLAPPAAGKADEHDVPRGLGFLASGPPDRLESLAGESVRHQRYEVVEPGGLADPLDGVGHHLLDLRTGKFSRELGAQIIDHPLDLMLTRGVKRHVLDWTPRQDVVCGDSAAGEARGPYGRL
jgi:hypothetical protein